MKEKPIRSKRIRDQHRQNVQIKTKTGWRLESHVVAEKKYGRQIKESENVHHIDGNRLNNHPDNLSILYIGDHVRLHHIGKKRPDVAIRMKNPETIRKINLAKMGHFVSIETREKIRKSNLGKKRSLETKQKLSNALKGRTITPEWRKKISESTSIAIKKWWAERRVS